MNSIIFFFVLASVFELVCRIFASLRLAMKQPVRKIELIKSGNSRGRTILVLEGCNQRDGLSEWLRKMEVTGPHDRIFLLKRRYHESHNQPQWYTVSWIPLWIQFREVLAAVNHAVKEGKIPFQFDVAGHSVGSILAKRLAEALPHAVEHVFLFNPPNEKRFSLLMNWEFWKKVGFRALLHSIWTLIVSWRGFTPQTTVTRLAYLLPTSKEHKVLAFRRALLPDSTLTFYGLFWYKGGELERGREKGWKGKAYYIATPNDLLFSAEVAEQDAQKQPQTQFVKLETDTPHCFWQADHSISQLNAVLIRKAMSNQ